MSSRLLLGPGHSHGGRVVEPDHADAHDHAHAHEGHNHAEDVVSHMIHASTLDLRVAAIFVIWFAAVLFGLPTLVLKQFRNPNAMIPRMLRAFAGGVIVALALVHTTPAAIGDLNGLMDFPIGGCTVLFGVVILVLIDNCLISSLAPDHYKKQIRDQIAAYEAAATAAAEAEAGEYQQIEAGVAPKLPGEQRSAVHGAVGTSTHMPHGHMCLSSLSASGWMAAEPQPSKDIRQYVTAYTMELGCIFHSVIIGVGLGVMTQDRSLVVTFMIALAIHQGLEGLALGSVLAMTRFSNLKRVLMLLMYSITTPLGVAIGIGVAAEYDPDSVTSRAVQGTFNGVSSGMLLYIGMYQLLAEEFSRDDILVKPKLRYGMYAAMLLGAASMCIIGIWA